ncbi:hypothetical protein [Nitratifractor sp.]|uniref:hypothetical protein n=1 Tax=Nitratifractor sp. TaxID=2268144 RepID=UPI0025D7684C|nr:hypothetical protein [Nitratifractor sp.]
MSSTEKQEENSRYRWFKRGVALAAVGIWIALIIHIFQGGGGMNRQAPKCLFTTMIVFGILTAVYKGIEQREKESEE